MNYKNGSLKNSQRIQGLSVIEVMLAVVMFSILAVSGVSTIVHTFSVNRQGEEQTEATLYAQEGIEAVKSMKNRGWSTIVPTGTYGLSASGSLWNFSGAQDTRGRFTRQVQVQSVNRDGSGTIVSSGGTLDSDTKKITSTVNWNFYANRNETISLSTYLTNFRKLLGDGILVYGDTASIAQPRYRSYSNSTDTFNSEAATGSSFTDTIVGKTFRGETSPTKQEAIFGYVNNSGILRIVCYDGTNWSSEWTVPVGGIGTNESRFGIAYETNSGDVLVVYSTNNASTNELAYRTKTGSSGCGSASWSGVTNIDTQRTNSTVQWVRMEGNPLSSSNNIALAWVDNQSDLSAMQWTGSSWGIAEPSFVLEANLERVGTSADVPSFDLAFESVTGNVMVVWGLSQSAGCTAGTVIATTNCIRYARYTTSWSPVAVIPTVADPATNIDISGNPNTNELVMAALDNSQADLSIAHWSGSVWTGLANQDTSTATPVAGGKYVATGWLINGGTARSVVTFVNSAAQSRVIHGFVGNGASFTRQGTESSPWFTPSTLFANTPSWYDIQMDPKNKERLMFTVSDSASDLFAKRLTMSSVPAFTWTNTDGGLAVETNLGQGTASPFGFLYWRN